MLASSLLRVSYYGKMLAFSLLRVSYYGETPQKRLVFAISLGMTIPSFQYSVKHVTYYITIRTH
jgi:hypothetical protein